ncbi:MAG: hypothetical protein RXP86_12190 [Acidilobus sp.]
MGNITMSPAELLASLSTSEMWTSAASIALTFSPLELRFSSSLSRALTV